MKFRSQVKQGQKIIFLSPLSTVHIFSPLRSHGVHRKRCDWVTLYICEHSLPDLITYLDTSLLMLWSDFYTYLINSHHCFRGEDDFATIQSHHMTVSFRPCCSSFTAASLLLRIPFLKLSDCVFLLHCELQKIYRLLHYFWQQQQGWLWGAAHYFLWDCQLFSQNLPVSALCPA